MATKAELEAELASLKREMAQATKRAEPDISEPHDREGSQTALGSEELKRVLDEHGIDIDAVESLGENIFGEVRNLQKENPLIVLVAVFALGCIVGRTFK